MPILKRLKEALFGAAPAPDPTQARIAELEGQVRVKTLEASLDFFNSFVDPTEPLWDDTDFWLPLGLGERIPWTLDNYKKGEVLPVYITWYGLKVIRDYSRRLCAFNEFAINAVENRISYITGKGFGYKVLPRKKGPADPLEAVESDGLCERVQDFVDEWRAVNCWGEREQESVRRADRDGEFFHRLFHVGRGMSEVRFIEPEWVRDDGKGKSPNFGVETDPLDTEDVKGFWVVPDPQHDQEPEYVPAEEVVHLKLNVDGTSKRGLPTFFPVRKNLERADKLLRNMSTMAQVRATFAVIRKHAQMGKSAVSAFQQGQADVTMTTPFSGRTNYISQRQPGEIIDTTKQTEYEFPGIDADAGAFVQILQAELRAIASRLVMPEYMLTSDASNANYASTMVAEAPSTRNFERLQAKFARHFGDGPYSPRHAGTLWRAIEIAVRFGRLPREALTDVEIQVEGPTLVAREAAEETNRHAVLNQAGVMSKATWAHKEGLDYEQEKQQVEEEGGPGGQQQPGQPGQPGGGGDSPPGAAGDGSGGDEPRGGMGRQPEEPNGWGGEDEYGGVSLDAPESVTSHARSDNPPASYDEIRAEHGPALAHAVAHAEQLLTGAF